MTTEDEIQSLVSKCRVIPRAKGNYLISDFVENLILTVVDFQMHTTAVERAHRHFKLLQHELRSINDLKAAFARYPDTKDGNTALARYLWGYKLWTRAEMLRRLVEYFESEGVKDQDGLREWAANSRFERDFSGRVRGLGKAVYNWLIMRQGIETIKPDVHIRRFVESALERPVSDDEVVSSLEEVASRLAIKAYELDWRIWESQRDSS